MKNIVQYQILPPLLSVCPPAVRLHVTVEGGAGGLSQQQHTRASEILYLRRAKLKGQMTHRQLSF